MNMSDLTIGKHIFPDRIRELGLDPTNLHQDVFDLETWIERVRDFADSNASKGYENAQIRGDAFEHFIECVIEQFGHYKNIDCVRVEALRENTDGIDLIGETDDGRCHAHQCKFRGDTKLILDAERDKLDVFAGACFTNNIELGTIWTTAEGIHSRTQARFRDKIRTFGYREICDFVDGEDGANDFWQRYAESLGAVPERMAGLINTPGSITIRDYQKEALDTFKAKIEEQNVGEPLSLKGRYVYPTGAGKTLIECLILNFQMNRTNSPGTHIVIAPKIELVNQLMRDYRRNIGDNYHAIGFHSGENVYYRNERGLGRTQRNTTEVDRVRQAITTNQRQKRHLVIFSTYDSLHKLAQSEIDFDTLIADESQYCISEHYFEQVRLISSKVKLFFTATEKHGIGDVSDDRRSNDNEKVFGSLLGYETYANLIDKGILVKPLIHVLLGNRVKRNRDSIVDESIYIANQQRKMTEKSIHSKVLFACNKTDSIKVIVDQHIDEIQAGTTEHHKIFTIISDPKYKSMINGKPIDKRANFLGQLTTCESNAMIFHYNILSEGIDVDGITGVAIMRAMSKSRLLQTVGRSMRPLRDEIDVPAEERRKRNSYISVPVIDGNVQNSEILRKVIRGMITGGLEVNVEEFEFGIEGTDDGNGSGGERIGVPRSPPNEPEDDFIEELLQTKLKNVSHQIEEIKSDIEGKIDKERRKKEIKHQQAMDEILNQMYLIEPEVMSGILEGRC